MDFNKINRNYIGVFIILIMLYHIIRQQKRMRDDALSMNIFGVVSKVEYSVQRIPTFVVNGKKYDTYEFIWDYDTDYMQVGDTVVKRKGSIVLKVKKHKP